MFRKLAHLREQIGDERFAALIDSGNTGKVKEFCDQFLRDVLPTEMTVGGRTYEILGFLREDDGGSVVGHTMIDRAKEMKANFGKEDGEHILKHQDEIPSALRGRVFFVFPDWRNPGDHENVRCVHWKGDRWAKGWGWLLRSVGWGDSARLLRK